MLRSAGRRAAPRVHARSRPGPRRAAHGAARPRLCHTAAVTDNRGEQPTSDHARTGPGSGPTPRRDAARGHRGLDRLLQDQRARLDRRARDPRRHRHLLHDGLHRGAEPDHPRLRAGRGRALPRRRHGDGSNLPAIAAGTALVAGVMTILMGVVANYPLALATGLGLNAFVAFAIATPDDLGRRDGPGRARGPRHPGAGADRLPDGGLPRRPGPAQDRDLGRHRAVHRAHRLRRRRLRAPYARRGQHDRARCSSASAASSQGWPVLVFALGLLLVIALWVRRVRGRDPDRDRRHHDPGDHRRGDGASGRCSARRRVQPERAGGSPCPRGPTTIVDTPGLRHAGALQPVRLLRRRSGSSRRCCWSSP